MATENRAGGQPNTPGAAKRNYDRLARKLGVGGGAPAASAPAASAVSAPAPPPTPLSASQALAMAGKLMDLELNEFEAEAKRLRETGQAKVLKALASSRPDFEQDIDVIRKWARCSYASFLAKEMTDDARWQVARLLNDRLLLWVEVRSDRVAEELRAIRQAIGF